MQFRVSKVKGNFEQTTAVRQMHRIYIFHNQTAQNWLLFAFGEKWKLIPLPHQRNTSENYVKIIDRHSEFSHHPSRYLTFQEKCNNLSSNLFRFCYSVANYEHAFADEWPLPVWQGAFKLFKLVRVRVRVSVGRLFIYLFGIFFLFFLAKHFLIFRVHRVCVRQFTIFGFGLIFRGGRRTCWKRNR